MAFTESTYHALVDHGSTTVQTVFDADGKLKNALHNIIPNTDLSDTDDWTQEGLDSLVESGTGAKSKPRYLLTEDTSTGKHRAYDAVSYESGGYYRHSIDVKGNGRDLLLHLAFTRFGTAVAWLLDTSTGTITQNTGGTKDAAFVTPLGDDEYRVDMYAEATGTGTNNLRYALHNGSSASYTGDGSSGVYLSRPRVMKASVHAPVERVTNGDFATDTDWTKGTNATISGGTLSYAGGSGNTDTYQTIGAQTVGDTIRIEFTISNYVSGTASVRTSGGTTADQNADGTYVETIVLTGSGGTLYVDVSNNFVGDVDNVSWTKVITDGVQLDDDGEDFMATTGAAVYSDGVAYDGNGACLGLQCFSGSTNLLPYSNDLTHADWTPTDVTKARVYNDKTGDLDATELTEGSTASTQHRIADIATITNSTDHVAMAVVKRGTGTRDFGLLAVNAGIRVYFNLGTGAVGAEVNGTGSIIPWGDDYYLCAAFGTSTTTTVTYYLAICDGTTSGSETYNGDGSSSLVISHAALYAGSILKPYTPTDGSAVTRSANGASKAISTFGYRQDQGTVVATFQGAGSNGSDYPSVFGLNDGTGSNIMYPYANPSNILKGLVRYNTVDQALMTGGAYTPDTVATVAMAYKADDAAISLDGAAVDTDTSLTIPPVTTVNVGTHYASNNHLNGYIKKLVYYPTRLADATLVEESA